MQFCYLGSWWINLFQCLHGGYYLLYILFSIVFFFFGFAITKFPFYSNYCVIPASNQRQLYMNFNMEMMPNCFLFHLYGQCEIGIWFSISFVLCGDIVFVLLAAVVHMLSCSLLIFAMKGLYVYQLWCLDPKTKEDWYHKMWFLN